MGIKPEDETTTDKYLRLLKNNRIYATVFVLSAILATIVAIVSSLTELNVHINEHLINRHIVIDDMDSTRDWTRYDDGTGSSIAFTQAYDDAIEIRYELVHDGHVGISKVFESGLSSETDGISFSYRGSGASNTIEFKLLYEADTTGRSTMFSKTLDQKTVANEWRTLEVRYSEFDCWHETGCSSGEEVDPERVWVVDFAISNKPGDTPGVGFITIDDVRGIPAR